MSGSPPILFLSSHHGTGASESLWIETAAHLADAGEDIRALVAWRRRDEKRLSPLRQRHVPCTYLNTAAGNVFASRVLRRILPAGALEIARFRRALRSIRPATLIVSEGNDVSALPYLEAALAEGVRYQVVTHGLNPADWPRDDVADRLRHVFTLADHSYWVAARNITEFEYHIGARLPRASVVRNPLKIARDQPFAWPSSQDPFRMACVARMQTRPKGHDLLLQALAHPRWQSRPLHLSFFGEGENRRGIERLAELLGISSRVHFRGHVDSVADIWKDHHLLAQPSRNEGMPLSLVEALFAGRPALATDVAGHAELITDNENGFIAEAATVAHIDQALERAWLQRDRWQAMGRAAYERIREEITGDPVADFADRIRGAGQRDVS